MKQSFISTNNSIIFRNDLTSSMIAAHQADDESNFTGWSNTTGFSTVTVTTPDALRTQVESWRSNTNNLLQIICDWDGPLNMTSASIRGPTNTALTANGTRLDGFNRPTGGVWIKAANGRFPAFGNPITVNGMPRIHFDSMGFAAQANGGNADAITALRFQASSTFPLYALASFINCDFGLDAHRPTQPPTEYVKGIGSGFCYTLHIENTRFAGCRDSIQGLAKFLRIWGCRGRKLISDFSTQFGFTTSNWSDQRCYAWIERNVVSDLIDSSGFNGLHTDFFQIGTSLDVHVGNDVLLRYNIAHMKTSISTDSGTQFFYSDDHTTAYNNAVVHDNIAATSAYNIAQIYDPSGRGVWYIENNNGLRAGNYLQSGPEVYPRINDAASNLVGNIAGTISGAVFVRNNYLTRTVNVNNLPWAVTGNRYHSPIRNIISGDGLTENTPKRTEDVFSLSTAIRNVNDTLTYTVPGEDSADYTTAYHAIANFMIPIAGWGVDAGCSDPSTRPNAP